MEYSASRLAPMPSKLLPVSSAAIIMKNFAECKRIGKKYKITVERDDSLLITKRNEQDSHQNSGEINCGRHLENEAGGLGCIPIRCARNG